MSEKILVDTEIREQEVNFIFIYSIKLILKLHLDIGGNKHDIFNFKGLYFGRRSF